VAAGPKPDQSPWRTIQNAHANELFIEEVLSARTELRFSGPADGYATPDIIVRRLRDDLYHSSKKNAEHGGFSSAIARRADRVEPRIEARVVKTPVATCASGGDAAAALGIDRAAWMRCGRKGRKCCRLVRRGTGSKAKKPGKRGAAILAAPLFFWDAAGRNLTQSSQRGAQRAQRNITKISEHRLKPVQILTALP